MAKDNNPKRTATRRSKQQRRLPPDATCTCGENDPTVLELHHPTGREHDKNLIIVACKNCHAKQTEGQLEGEVPLGATDNWFDRGAGLPWPWRDSFYRGGLLDRARA